MALRITLTDVHGQVASQMRVYIPAEVQREIQHAGNPAVETALNKIMQWARDYGTQGMCGLADHKLPGGHLIFRLGRSHRLLARCETVNGCEVLVLLRCLLRGDNDYLPMLDRIRNADYSNLPDITQADLEEYLNERPEEGLDPTPAQVLPEELHLWLSPPPGVTSPEYVIFEGHDWVSTFGIKQFADYWQDFHETVRALIVNDGASAVPAQEFEALEPRRTGTEWCDHLKVKALDERGAAAL